MKRAPQPQGDGTWLFLQDGEQVWWGQDFVECIEQARLDSIGEVRKMVEAEDTADLESLERVGTGALCGEQSAGFLSWLSYSGMRSTSLTFLP